MSALDILIALFAAIGILAVLWLIIGKLFTPAPAVSSSLLQVLPASGDGHQLEGQVRAILWQNYCQSISCPLILADCGLNAEGLKAAHCLTRRWPAVHICKPEELGALLSQTDGKSID